MLANFILALVLLLVSYVLVDLFIPIWIKEAKKRKIVGKDMNKLNKPEVPEMGGVVILIAFLFSISFVILLGYIFTFIKIDFIKIVVATITIAAVGVIGIIDDISGWKKGIKKWQHAVLPLFASIPLAMIMLNYHFIELPMLGKIEVGYLYAIVLVPLGITGTSNAFNMLAGLNGLEAGQGIIIISSLIILSTFKNQEISIILGLAFLGGLLAFFKYNKYPAKIFGGDSLTLTTGAVIGTISIISHIELAGVFLISLYFIEFILKAKHKFKSECFGKPQKDGTLKPLTKDGSITQLVMSIGKFTEKEVVTIILSIQTTISLIVISLFLLLL